MKNKLDESRPIYIQIKEFLEDSILSETLQANDKVPSTNELAKFYKINPATARQGINELVTDGVLRKQRGVGMFVTEMAREILIAQRTEGFYQHFIVPLKMEAKKLNISDADLQRMLLRGDK